MQRESDYRSARDAGEGGVAGTGMGVGNEFVLVDAETKPASGEAAEAGATGTSGSAMASKAYELTGPNEGQASQYVGRRVEITERRMDDGDVISRHVPRHRDLVQLREDPARFLVVASHGVRVPEASEIDRIIR